MQDRWTKMADLWDVNKGESDLTLLQNLNYLNKLTSQLEYLRDPGSRPVRIAYTTSGRPTAALITNHKAILDTKLYQVICRDLEEAYYLLAIINSITLEKAVAPFQAKGQLGERDLHKHLWKLPIPAYDRECGDHFALAALGKRAADEAAAVIEGLAAMEGKTPTSQKARAQLRNEWQPGSVTAQAIEEGVRGLLGG